MCCNGKLRKIKDEINKMGKKAAKICIHMGLQSATGEHICKLYV